MGGWLDERSCVEAGSLLLSLMFWSSYASLSEQNHRVNARAHVRCNQQQPLDTALLMRQRIKMSFVLPLPNHHQSPIINHHRQFHRRIIITNIIDSIRAPVSAEVICNVSTRKFRRH